MLRRAVSTALSVVLLVTLAGCASDTEAYCSDLRDERKTLQGLGGSVDTLAGFQDSLEVFDALAAKAPRDVADEWETFVVAWQSVVDALEAAGVSPAEITGGRRPDGVGKGELAAIRQAAEKLRSADVVQAAQGIEQHAADVCKVELRESGLTG